MKGGDIAGHEARDAAEARVLGAAEELFVGGNVRGIPGGDGRGVLPAPCEGDWRSSTLYRSPLQQEQHLVQARSSAGGFTRLGAKDVPF
jgi:hypothetical protein